MLINAAARDLVQWIKRHAVWCALGVTVLLVWQVSEDDESTLEPMNNTPAQRKIVKDGRSTDEQATDVSQGLPPAQNTWPHRGRVTALVVDIFNPLTAEAQGKNEIATSGKAVVPPKPPVEQSFRFSYFGRVEKDGNVLLFLQDESQNVVPVSVGQHINTQWQFVDLDAGSATFKHNESGKLFQLITRSSE